MKNKYEVRKLYSKAGKYLGTDMEFRYMPKGYYLVRIKENSTGITPLKNHKLAETEMVLREIQEQLVGLLADEAKGHPQIRYNTPTEMKAIAEYYRILGTDNGSLVHEIKSYWEIVEKAMDLVRKELSEKS